MKSILSVMVVSTSRRPPGSSSRRWPRAPRPGAWECRGATGPSRSAGTQIPVGGDIILSVEDVPVVSEENIEKIRNMLAGLATGAPFKMSVLRAGKVIELTGTSQ